MRVAPMTTETLARRVGRRVVITTRTGLVYGAAGKLTIQSVDEVGGVTLALPKGAPAAYIPAKHIASVQLFREEV